MNARRKYRFWFTLLSLGGAALTLALILFALRANIDLFYTPGEVIHGAHKTGQPPTPGQRLRVGGFVAPGSVRHSASTMEVTFKLYDAGGSVTVSYIGLLPDLFREGQGVVVQGVLAAGHHIIAREVLAKHDEKYTPPGLPAAGREGDRA